MTDVYEALRWTNLVAAVTLTLLMLLRLRAFARAPWPSKVGRLSVFGWVTSTAYGTWEALHTAVLPGFRVPAVTSVLTLSGYWLLVEYLDDRKHARELAHLRAVLRDSPPQGGPGR